MRLFSPFLLAFCLFSAKMAGQTVLLDENFNDCAGLPSGWAVEIQGNQQAAWHVGVNQNDDLPGESIDGTCQLQIDDDATGDGSPSFVWRATTPVFDGSAFSTVRLAVDVHYRDWNEADESFKIYLKDENGLHLLRKYDETRSTGEHFWEYETAVFDLAFYSKSAQMQLVFEYDDAGGFAWWAAIDNLKITGEGAGRENVVAETFDGCAKPAGWETEILTGDTSWQFGICQNGGAFPKSMNGSCFAFFDDDILGQDAPFSAARLKTPFFDGSAFGTFGLEADVLHRFYSETLSIFVENGATGEEKLLAEFGETVGGEQFDEFENLKFDLSPFRSKSMRVIFQYADGQDWGWWTGLDNVKIWGEGQINDDCSRSKTLAENAACVAQNNLTALFTGPAPACVQKAEASIWFDFQPSFSGVARIDSKADFNDVLEVFSGGCDALLLEKCGDRDEHGFEGESLFFDVLAGKTYKIRVFGKVSPFGKERGSFCVSVKNAPNHPQKPANDLCQNAQNLAIDGPCFSASNVWAESDGPRSSRADLARHDIWFRFDAPSSGEKLLVESMADFSDVLTVFSGSCADLAEVTSNDLGQKIELENLTAGQTYFLQLAGNMATVEGSACVSVRKKADAPPANETCSTASVLALGAACEPFSNAGAAFWAEKKPSCALDPTRDVWFRFVAGPSGAVKIWTGAHFPHVAAIWKGSNCGALEEVFCAKNPLRCDGFFDVTGLAAGKNYWLQIASFLASSGSAVGAFCPQILDGSAMPTYEAMGIEVTEFCIGTGEAVIDAKVTGGAQPIDYQGLMPGSQLPSGSNYLIVATDAAGCVQSVSSVVGACDQISCSLSLAIGGSNVACFGDSTGAATANVLGAQGGVSFQWSFQNQSSATATGLPAGAYTVTATDGAGCLSVGEVQIFQPSAPLEVFLTAGVNPTAGAQNGSLDVEAVGGASPYLYYWKNSAGFASSDEDLAGLGAGTYFLTVTDAGGCTFSIQHELFEVVSTGDFLDEKKVSLAPNPTSGRAFLRTQLPENERVMIEVTNASGQKTVEKTAFSGSIEIDLSSQPTGVFWVRVFSEKRVWARRLVVAR